jgi:formate dehydrogenase alpha subunit
MTNSIADIGEAACIMSVGSNTTASHPIIGFKVKQAVQKGTKLIVINPREIALCQYADIWLRLRPGTDIPLLMGMMRVILEQGLHDEEFIARRCENFPELKNALEDFTLEKVEEITSVPQSLIIKAALMYAVSKPASIIYTLGVTEHVYGTDGVMALANLAMLTGNIGKPGSGVNPLRGQNNVQGACDMGALPGNFPGYQAVDNPLVRKKFEEYWSCSLNPVPGKALTEIYEAAFQKEIKTAYIIGEDPVLSEPNMNHTIEALKNLEFLVVQEIFLSETAKLAHVVLPAAGFAADDGTFTNTERRIQRIRKAVSPPGDARPDWEIICMIARKMGKPGFVYRHPSEIWEEIVCLTPSMAGISYERLEEGGLQWPCPTPEHPGTPILHSEIFTRGKGKFMSLKYRLPAEVPDAEYPLVLTTERSIYHYHTGTMTRRVHGLNVLRSEELVEMNPRDAASRGISDGDWVTVSSRRGKVNARARVTEVSPEGLVCMTFHFAESPTNALTNNAVDPIAKTPEIKYCAVNVSKQAT